jgi:hypothetical protein
MKSIDPQSRVQEIGVEPTRPAPLTCTGTVVEVGLGMLGGTAGVLGIEVGVARGADEDVEDEEEEEIVVVEEEESVVMFALDVWLLTGQSVTVTSHWVMV